MREYKEIYRGWDDNPIKGSDQTRWITGRYVYVKPVLI